MAVEPNVDAVPAGLRWPAAVGVRPRNDTLVVLVGRYRLGRRDDPIVVPIDVDASCPLPSSLVRENDATQTDVLVRTAEAGGAAGDSAGESGREATEGRPSFHGRYISDRSKCFAAETPPQSTPRRGGASVLGLFDPAALELGADGGERRDASVLLYLEPAVGDRKREQREVRINLDGRMRAPASQQLVVGLEEKRLLEVGEELVVLDDVLAALEIPPAVLVVGVALCGFDGLEVGVGELVAAEVEAPRGGDLVDRAHRQVDAAVVDLYRFVHQVVDGVRERVVVAHIGRTDGPERQKISRPGESETVSSRREKRRRMDVNQQRLRRDIEENAAFGAIDAETGRGRTVLAGTDANREARDRFVDRCEAAGLEVEIDAVGNLAATWVPENADPEAAPVAAGSHLDSVPEGGIFDGPLGTYGALEAVRTVQESARAEDLERPIVVVCFTEEEGTRFGGGMFGSSVATGRRSVDDALAVTDDEGVTVEAALESIGYRGEGALDVGAWDAFLELHVEQDTRLENRGVPVGVVTTITGIAHATIEVEGEANHAGTTGMDERTDALAAASEVVLELESTGRDRAEAGEGTAVATVGKSRVRPNATNVVPGAVELGVDVRDVEYETMEAIVEEATATLERLEAERGVETRFEREIDVEPAPMDRRCRDALERAGAEAEIDTLAMHSGAAHDAMRVSRVTDAGMLFAPSRDGLSHTPLEWTDWEDCATATRVLAGALAELAGDDEG